MAEILRWAKEYVNSGWHVFPLHGIDGNGQCTCGTKDCGDAGKHPRLSAGLKGASRDLSAIEDWFGPEAPISNIAILTGEASGITVIDIDIGDGKLGDQSWAAAIEGHGEPDTLMAATGGGGIHAFFKYSSAHKTAANVLGKGIDCRNDRGYVVAAPSSHRKGGVYRWENWGAELAHLPSHLSQRVEQRGRPKGEGSSQDSSKRNREKKYTLDQIESMLEVIPSDDRDLWRHIGIILGRVYKRSDAAWDAYNVWADKDGGKKGRNHDAIMHESFYTISMQDAESQLSIGTIVKLAVENGWAPKKGEVPIDHFIYYGPGNNFIYRPTASYWIASAVDAAVSPVNIEGKIMSASDWLKQNQLATSMTSDPAQDEDYIKGYDCRKGDIVSTPGAALYNTYRKPSIELGDAKLAKPFLDHVNRVFNKQGDAKQFIDYMAHRVQKPWEKPRFALLIAGMQGVGKDTAIEMCCPAIGAWNVANIEPDAFMSNFNEYVASTLVRISEAANLHEMSKWAFNERTKVLIAGSPDNIDVNPKYGQKYTVKMYCGVIITTNHLISGIYIPSDDRRYDVIDSATFDEMWVGIDLTDSSIDDEKVKYFEELWGWFYAGGANHIAALLREHDVSGFSASNGQRKTSAHSMVVAGSMTSDSWLVDAIESFGDVELIRGDWLLEKICDDGSTKQESVKPRLTATISRAGWTLYRNCARKDGRWSVNGKNVTVYAKVGTVMDSELPGYLKGENHSGGRF